MLVLCLSFLPKHRPRAKGARREADMILLRSVDLVRPESILVSSPIISKKGPRRPRRTADVGAGSAASPPTPCRILRARNTPRHPRRRMRRVVRAPVQKPGRPRARPGPRLPGSRALRRKGRGWPAAQRCRRTPRAAQDRQDRPRGFQRRHGGGMATRPAALRVVPAVGARGVEFAAGAGCR
jgi:hypothetical protein